MKKWRRWLWVIHRDLGYFFFAATVIYALSGIAINHINDWNPNFIVNTKEFKINLPKEGAAFDKQFIMDELQKNDVTSAYKKHYSPSEGLIKVFVKDGNILIDTDNGDAFYESLHRRPIFHAFNYLHYNPVKYWTWFADAYAIALLILAISGLFLLKGKKGITGRGAWLTLLGILVPLLILLIYY